MPYHYCMELSIENYEIYIRPGDTDMRKGARSLALFVQNEMELCPFDKKIFVFCGRDRRIMKAIIWDGTGWFEIIKRLDRSSFKWPNTKEAASKVSLEQVLGCLKGHDTWRHFDMKYPKYAN